MRRTSVCLIWSLFAAMAASGGEKLAGDYAGWAYGEDGDFPLRLRIEAGDPPRVFIHSPAQRVANLPTENVHADAGGLAFDRVNSKGNRLSYHLQAQTDALRGKIVVDGKDYCTLELGRAAEPLPVVDPAAFANAAGPYRASSGAALVLSPWFWGEMRLLDMEMGAERTLFARSESELFAGPCQYVPRPAEINLKLLRDDTGRVAQIEKRDAGGTTIFRRQPMVEQPLEFENAGLQFHGTLIRADVAERQPVVIVLGGSNWTKRESCRRDADAFAAMGVSAFVYDQRGSGETGGNALCSFDDIAGDVRAAINMLASRPEVDPARIGLFGRSRGGWLAPLSASKCDKVAFVVLFVAPAISPEQQENTRRLNEFRAAGHNDSEVREASEYLQLMWRSVDSDAQWQRYAARRDELAPRGWLDVLGSNSEPDEWQKLNMRYDPIPALEKLKCPVLALFGENDTNVTPAENVSLMQGAFKRGANRDATIQIVPRASHGLWPVVPGAAATPLHRAIGSCPEVWNTVRRWLEQRKYANPPLPG